MDAIKKFVDTEENNTGIYIRSCLVNKKINIPKSYEENIRRAVEILREAGCSDIFLFGSLAEDNFREGSDIDIAVRGCPRKKLLRREHRRKALHTGFHRFQGLTHFHLATVHFPTMQSRVF